MSTEKILNKYIEFKSIGDEKYVLLNTNVKTLQEELEKQLSLHSVSQQLELLKAYENMLLNAGDLIQEIEDQDRNDFIDSFNRITKQKIL